MSKTTSMLVAGLLAATLAAPALAQQVIKDPLTNVLRGVTPEEAAAMQPATAPNLTLLPKYSATGAIGTRLNDDHMSYAVVVRRADGSLEHRCLADKAAAVAAVKNATPAPSFARPISLQLATE
ncbi:MAG: hypothetical protein CFE45_08380 [Burkholderiales bacterium PBB5]|nr:MAG: hypothetical protein CFE45_08380 [Burkholderiales bacterium PBB5]